MNETIRRMKQAPGLYIVTRPESIGYAFVLVEEDGTVHQIKMVHVDKENNTALVKKDGLLDDEGWYDNVIAEGPIPCGLRMVQ